MTQGKGFEHERKDSSSAVFACGSWLSEVPDIAYVPYHRPNLHYLFGESFLYSNPPNHVFKFYTHTTDLLQTLPLAQLPHLIQKFFVRNNYSYTQLNLRVFDKHCGPRYTPNVPP